VEGADDGHGIGARDVKARFQSDRAWVVEKIGVAPCKHGKPIVWGSREATGLRHGKAEPTGRREDLVSTASACKGCMVRPPAAEHEQAAGEVAAAPWPRWGRDHEARAGRDHAGRVAKDLVLVGRVRKGTHKVQPNLGHEPEWGPRKEVPFGAQQVVQGGPGVWPLRGRQGVAPAGRRGAAGAHGRGVMALQFLHKFKGEARRDGVVAITPGEVLGHHGLADPKGRRSALLAPPARNEGPGRNLAHTGKHVVGQAEAGGDGHGAGEPGRPMNAS